MLLSGCKMPRIKGWKKIGKSGDNIYWETKKKVKNI